MSTAAEPSTMLVAVYQLEWKARRGLEVVEALEEEGPLELEDSAVLVKHSSGKLDLAQSSRLTTKKGAQRGALIGAIVGVVFPPSLLASAALGAAAGAVAGRAAEGDEARQQLGKIGAELQPGQSALIVVVEDRWADAVEQALDDYDQLHRRSLGAEEASS